MCALHIKPGGSDAILVQDDGWRVHFEKCRIEATLGNVCQYNITFSDPNKQSKTVRYGDIGNQHIVIHGKRWVWPTVTKHIILIYLEKLNQIARRR